MRNLAKTPGGGGGLLPPDRKDLDRRQGPLKVPDQVVDVLYTHR